MKTDKEYPATHSMSTAWYMVDDDGNVGIMDFNDNGPVPQVVYPTDYSSGGLFFGEGFDKKENPGGILLSQEQLKDLLGEPKPVLDADEIYYWSGCFMKIDTSKRTYFLNLCKSKDCLKVIPILYDEGIYYVSFSKDIYRSRDFKIKKRSSLNKMLEAKLIIGVFDHYSYFAIDESQSSDEGVRLRIDGNVRPPYYIYAEPYFDCFIQERLHVPENSVKISQIKEEFRSKVLRIPGRFADMDKMQIARFHICNGYGPYYFVDNSKYIQLPIDEHENRFLLSEPFIVDYFDLCPKRKDYGCTECSSCVDTLRIDTVATPTVLFLVHPTSEKQPLKFQSILNQILWKTLTISVIPCFPFIKKGFHGWFLRDYRRYMTDESLTDIFRRSHAWLDTMTSIVSPNVIVIEDKVAAILDEVYDWDKDNHRIVINGNSITVFLLSEAKEHREDIIRRACEPYRGKIISPSYSVSEMEEMLNKRLASKIEET